MHNAYRDLAGIMGCAAGIQRLPDVFPGASLLSQKVKWLRSSHLEVDLLAELKNPGTNSLDTSNFFFELDTQRLADPVNAYIDHKLIALKCRKGYNDSTLAEVSCKACQ